MYFLCILFLLYFLHLLVFRANFSPFFLHSTSRPFSRLLNYFLCLFTLPTMTKSYSYRSTDNRRSSSSSCKCQYQPHFLVLHSLDVLLSFFLVLYLAIFLLLLPLSGNGTHSFSDIPHDCPSNLNATISFLTNSDSTGSLFFYTANGKYLSGCLNLTLFHLVTIIIPYHCNSLSYSLRSLVSCTSCTSSILSHRVSIITIVPYLFSDLSILPITFHCCTNPTVSHHHLHKYRNLFLFLLLILHNTFHIYIYF